MAIESGYWDIDCHLSGRESALYEVERYRLDIFGFIHHIRQTLETVSWKGAGLFQDCAWTCPETVGLYVGGFAGG